MPKKPGPTPQPYGSRTTNSIEAGQSDWVEGVKDEALGSIDREAFALEICGVCDDEDRTGDDYELVAQDFHEMTAPKAKKEEAGLIPSVEIFRRAEITNEYLSVEFPGLFTAPTTTTNFVNASSTTPLTSGSTEAISPAHRAAIVPGRVCER